MPSTVTSNRVRPTVLLVAVLAVLAVTAPVATVAGDRVEPSTANFATSGDGSTRANGPGVAGDRSACGHASGSTGPATTEDAPATPAVETPATRAADAPPPVPDESEDLDVALGDVAVVPLRVPSGENVTVVVGSGDGYTARLAVHDDGDGQVTLLVNTYLAGSSSTVAPGTYRVRGDDAVTPVGGNTTRQLEPGGYPVTVRQNGYVFTREKMIVSPPSVEGLTARRAAPQVFDAANASEIRAANRSGLVRGAKPDERHPVVVRGETLLLRFDAPSLLGAIAAQPGNTTAERFGALHNWVDPATPETFRIDGVCGGINFAESVAEGAVRVHTDYREGVVYVLLNRVYGVEDDQQTAQFYLAPESRLNDGDEGLTFQADFGIDDRWVSVDSYDWDYIELTDDEVEITGRTNLMPGSRIAVSVDSRVDPAFERRVTTTVAEDGSFAATVDLSNASDPGVFAVTAAGEQFPARIGMPPEVYWDVYPSGDSPVRWFGIRQVELPGAGFLVVYRYDPAADRFEVVGHAGEDAHQISIEPIREPQHLLVVAHRDRNGNVEFDGPEVDEPYCIGGRPASDWVSVSVNGTAPPGDPPATTFGTCEADRPPDTPTDAPDATPSPTPAATPATGTVDGTPVDTSGSPAGTADGTPVDTPGFGPVAAILALLGVLFAARRR